MKDIIIISVALLFLVACKKEPAYVICGEFPGAPEGTTVFLGKDSTQIIGGKFTFQGRSDVPVLTQLKVRGINQWGMEGFKGTPIWLENTEMQVICPWQSIPDTYDFTEQMTISGSALNDQYQGYRKEVAVVRSERDSLWKIYQKVYLLPSFEWKDVDVKAGMEVMAQIQAGRERRRKVAEKFIASHPDSPISLELLTGLLNGQDYTLEEAERMIGSLSPALKEIPAYAKLKAQYEAFILTAKGQQFIDVPLRDKEGKEVKLSDYIQPGKYNMLEFWASWCGPCRGEIPHLRHVNKVLGENFNIISISIDEKEAEWQKAMKQEGMVWTQLNVPGGFEGEACQKYDIGGVPYSLVLDGEGRIIAGEVRGAELDIILTELMPDKADAL